MISRNTILVLILIMAVLFAACGQSDKNDVDLTAADLIPTGLSSPKIVKSSGIDTFIGESLWKFIDGGADLYLQYGFVDAATSLYLLDDKEVQINIFRFNNSDAAYGLYATFRPDHSKLMQLGVEGFATSSSIDFVKGDYLVRVIGFDATSETINTIDTLARYIASTIPGTTKKPAIFELFPLTGIIVGSDKIEAHSFLGHAFLTDVYTRNYELDGDTVTLFVTNDSTGDKFLQWSQKTESKSGCKTNLDSLPFDQNANLLVKDHYWGTIVAGVRGDYLLGMINYDDARKNILIDWLRTLP